MSQEAKADADRQLQAVAALTQAIAEAVAAFEHATGAPPGSVRRVEWEPSQSPHWIATTKTGPRGAEISLKL